MCNCNQPIDSTQILASLEKLIQTHKANATSSMALPQQTTPQATTTCTQLVIALLNAGLLSTQGAAAILLLCPTINFNCVQFITILLALGLLSSQGYQFALQLCNT